VNEIELEQARAAHRAELAELMVQLERRRHAANCGPSRGMVIVQSANRAGESPLARLLTRLARDSGDPPAAWPYSASSD
jgi:hypothetical protein